VKGWRNQNRKGFVAKSSACVPSSVKRVHPAYLMRRCPRGGFGERFEEQIEGKLLGFYSLL